MANACTHTLALALVPILDNSPTRLCLFNDGRCCCAIDAGWVDANLPSPLPRCEPNTGLPSSVAKAILCECWLPLWPTGTHGCIPCPLARVCAAAATTHPGGGTAHAWLALLGHNPTTKANNNDGAHRWQQQHTSLLCGGATCPPILRPTNTAECLQLNGYMCFKH